MCRLIRLIAIAALVVAASTRTAVAQAPAQPSAVPHIYLIQNSGFMLAYFKDPNAKFRDFIADFIAATAPTGSPIVVADFNKDGQVRERRSPHFLDSGPSSPELIRRALARLDREPPTVSANPTQLADSDYSETLLRATREDNMAARQPAVIWMITNNMYAPPSTRGQLNDDVAKLTESFNTTLSEDNNIVRLFAIIKQMKATKPADRGVEFDGRGLVIYGMAYGALADGALVAAIGEVERRNLSETRPARLKPLAIAPLTYVPTAILTDGIDVSYDERGRFVLSNVPTGEPLTIRIEGTLSSNYFPQVIDSAIIRMTWESVQAQGIESVQGFGASLSRDRLERLRPSDKLEKVVMTLQLPPIERPAGLAGLMVKETRIDASIRFAIQDVRFELDEGFDSRMKTIFAANRWRAVFLDGFRVSDAATQLPITLVVSHSLWPLIGTSLASLLFLLMLAAGIWLATRERRFPIPVGGEEKMVSVKPFQTVTLTGRDGKPAVQATGRLFGPPSTRALAAPSSIVPRPEKTGTRIPRS